MTLQQVKYIITVSETGSINKAAEELYMAQPSLTSAIKELEGELHIQIFNRSGKGVTLTADGTEFLNYARQLYQQVENIQEKYISGKVKRKFGVSAQHYSFAVNAFVQTVQQFDPLEFDFAIRETTTSQVIEDVTSMKSEVGVLYLSDFNRQYLTRLIHQNHLEFHHLMDCDVYAYVWNGHPLAKKKEVSISELIEYPCLTFEQGDKSNFYLAEEIISTSDFQKVIQATDRSTMLNLMRGLKGYTFCSGIICGELNGPEYCAIPISDQTDKMEIGYICHKNLYKSEIAEHYIRNLKEYLGI